MKLYDIVNNIKKSIRVVEMFCWVTKILMTNQVIIWITYENMVYTSDRIAHEIGLRMIIFRIFLPNFLKKDFLFFGIVIKDCLNILKNAALKKLSIRFRSIDFWDNLFRLLMIIYSARSWFYNQNDNHERYDHWKNHWKNDFTSSVWRWESGSGSVNFGGTVSLLKNVESVNGSFPVA